MIIYIHGPDTFRSREKLHGLVAEFKKKRDPQGFNVVRLDGGALTFERFRHEALSQGFLAPKRMVVVERMLAQGKKEVADAVAAFLSSKTEIAGKEGNVIVFWEEETTLARAAPARPKTSRGKGAKAKRPKGSEALSEMLRAQEYVFDFPLLDPSAQDAWLRARAKEQGTAIEPAAAAHLREIAGGDMWRLQSELSKMIALRRGSTITMRDVGEAGEVEAEPTGFAFTDAVAARSLVQSLKELQALSAAGVEPLLIHGMLVRLFRTLALVKSYFGDETVRGNTGAAEDLGLHPFVVKKIIPFAARFSWRDIEEAYCRLLALDLKLKRQGDDPYLPLELFVMNLDVLSPSSH